MSWLLNNLGSPAGAVLNGIYMNYNLATESTASVGTVSSVGFSFVFPNIASSVLARGFNVGTSIHSSHEPERMEVLALPTGKGRLTGGRKLPMGYRYQQKRVFLCIA
ncbi:hypothetical protein CEXT_100051 [Caerostris extrusa]|uniref:Uncharacterized protein n=1 Tax=Caerostris extrusa TaxID=172846 RepID=A0AAV4YF16_CAEEX|nr:hypothetical protein CEXT_100051 [Caerostris extrusa]